MSHNESLCIYIIGSEWNESRVKNRGESRSHDEVKKISKEKCNTGRELSA